MNGIQYHTGEQLNEGQPSVAEPPYGYYRTRYSTYIFFNRMTPSIQKRQELADILLYVERPKTRPRHEAPRKRSTIGPRNSLTVDRI